MAETFRKNPADQSERPGNRIDGKALAEDLRKTLKTQVEELRKKHGAAPGLTVVLVGEDPASAVYVRKKGEACREIGMESFEHRLPAKTSHAELQTLIAQLNADRRVHGILVQLPLPAQINADEILRSIEPLKDVDGFHPENVGLLSLGRPRFVPCTPLGVMKLLERYQVKVEGLRAVVIGRSNIVGKPIANLLLQANATVTVCHSKTPDLPAVIGQADLVVAAIGKPHFVQGSWLKPGCVVIDVGINRTAAGKLVGDVDFEGALQRARLITPVPGGVGPMTIACLLENTLKAARLQMEKGLSS